MESEICEFQGVMLCSWTVLDIAAIYHVRIIWLAIRVRHCQCHTPQGSIHTSYCTYIETKHHSLRPWKCPGLPTWRMLILINHRLGHSAIRGYLNQTHFTLLVVTFAMCTYNHTCSIFIHPRRMHVALRALYMLTRKAAQIRLLNNKHCDVTTVGKSIINDCLACVLINNIFESPERQVIGAKGISHSETGTASTTQAGRNNPCPCHRTPKWCLL